jgi:hypothetical protein
MVASLTQHRQHRQRTANAWRLSSALQGPFSPSAFRPSHLAVLFWRLTQQFLHRPQRVFIMMIPCHKEHLALARPR